MLKTITWAQLGPFQAQVLTVALTTSEMSPDPSTKVGCAICTAINGEQASVHAGFNQFIALEKPEEATREERYARVVHAEMTALLAAGDSATGGLVCCSHEPCYECWKALAFVGPAEVIFVRTTDDRRERWGCEKGRALFREQHPDVSLVEVISVES